MLPVVDRRLLVEALRELRAALILGSSSVAELDFIIRILGDPDQEPTEEFKKSLAFARAQVARRLEN
jgi:hypothetical protein